MGPVVKLLQAIRSLTKSGAIKKIDDAYRLAQRELGERFSQYQNQIKDAFNQGQKEITKITNKPTADIIPFPKKKEGIETLKKEETSPLMQKLEKGVETLKQMKQPGMDLATGLTRTAARKILDRAGIQVPDKVDPTEIFIKEFGGDVLGDVQNVAEEMIEIERMGKATKSMDEILKEREAMYKPKPETSPLMEKLEKGVETLKQMKKPGMDLATGLTRTAARKILDRAGIQVPDKVDPTEVFIKEFGGDVLGDVKNVAEEMIELERMGKATKSMDEILEQTGMFNLKRGRTDMPRGYTDEEMEEIKKAIEQEDKLLQFDPKGRKPNARGGLQYLMGL